MLAGLGFDASVWEIWSTLAAGGTLAIPNNVPVFDVAAINGFYGRIGATHSFLSTPLAEELLGSGIAVPDSLRVLFTGGDRMRRWPPRDFGAAVINLYGPAEATVIATATEDLRGYDHTDFPPIGRPIDGVTCELRDDQRRVVTSDKPGELWIGGVGVAAGYYRDPAASRRAFLGKGQHRVYRSGDICKWREDGELAFLGRRDRQVKIRGYRVEPADIEAALLSQPDVRQAAVVLRDGPAPELVAYVAAKGGSPVGQVRERLAGMLPNYMVPTIIKRVHGLPLTSSGKVDYNSLSRVMSSATRDEQLGATDKTIPSDELERTVLEVMSHVLGDRPIGLDEDFFAAGGHSILAARVVVELRARLERDVTVNMIFKETSARGIAREIRRAPAHSDPPQRSIDTS